jgi:hypothetical protein
VIVIGAKRREDVGVVDQPPFVKGIIVAGSVFVLVLVVSEKGKRLWAVWAARSVRRPTSSWETRSVRFPQLGRRPQALRTIIDPSGFAMRDDRDAGRPTAFP